MKYLIICMTLKLRVLILMLYNGGVKLGLKNLHDLRYEQRGFHQFVHQVLHQRVFLIKTRDHYIQKGKIISKMRTIQGFIHINLVNTFSKEHP